MELLMDTNEGLCINEEFNIEDLILYKEGNVERIAEINFIGKDKFGYYVLSNQFTKIRLEKIIKKI